MIIYILITIEPPPVPSEVFHSELKTEIESETETRNHKNTLTTKTLNVTHSARLARARLSDSDSDGPKGKPKKDLKNGKKSKAVPQLTRRGTAPSPLSPTKRDIDWV